MKKALFLLTVVLALCVFLSWQSLAIDKARSWEGDLEQAEKGEVIFAFTDKADMGTVPDNLTEEQVVQFLNDGWLIPTPPLQTVPDGGDECHEIVYYCGGNGDYCRDCVIGYVPGQVKCYGCTGSRPIR